MLPRLGLGIRARTLANAAFATGYALAAHGRPNWRARRGVEVGLLAVSAVAAGYALAVGVPPLRHRLADFTDRGPEVPLAEWIAVHIPIGTAYSEELVFRATLAPMLERTLGARAGALLAAGVFGVWHIVPARAAGDSVPGTIAATAVAGLVFGELRRRTGGVVAPAAAHWAVNAGAAIATRLACRLDSSGDAGSAC